MRYTITAMRRGDDDLVLAASSLFDVPPVPELVHDFLHRHGHHLLLAIDDCDVAIGFVSAVEIAHPDKPVELLVYELGVDEAVRRQGVGTALLEALTDIARGNAMRGIWVVTEPDNEAAGATYRRMGGATAAPAVTFEWRAE